LLKEAPGPDKLSFEAVWLLSKWNRTRNEGLTKAVVGKGLQPAVWKRASEAVIRKPGNEDYPKLKSYQTISVVSCMGKVVEKVVAELLSNEAERRALLSDGQFGSRKKRSAIDATAIIVDRAHAAAMIPPVQQLTSPDRVRPSPVQSSPIIFWTGLGPIPNFSGPGLNWPGLLWTSPFGPNRPEYAGSY